MNRERAIKIMEITRNITRRLDQDPTQGNASLSNEQANRIVCTMTMPPPERPGRRHRRTGS